MMNMTVSTTLRVPLGEFQSAALGRMARAEGRPPESVLVRCLDFYLDDRSVDSPGWAFPGFLDDLPSGRRRGPALAVELPGRLARRLAAECRRQGVEPDRLIGHAFAFAAAAQDRARPAA